MTSHELARKLLGGPDLPITIESDEFPEEYWEVREITGMEGKYFFRESQKITDTKTGAMVVISW